MPELPELEIVTEVLQRRVVGRSIEAIKVEPKGGAIVIRDLTNRGFEQTLLNSTIKGVTRRGKFLLFSIEPLVHLVLNPKLTGRLQLAAPSQKRMPKTHIVFSLSSGDELRYVDQKTMGQVYLTDDLNQVNDYPGLGPEPFDISLDEFRERLKPYRGEIKGVLVRSEFIAGIGNAYADEILWAAKIHPYRKRTQLSGEEIDRLYAAIQSVLREATDKVRIEMGESIHLKPRDFMAVHMKTDQSCPRCGNPISLIGANERITNFCRNCQPGGLIKGM
jgi:formamidopyrimidine-DNA glycosylase